MKILVPIKRVLDYNIKPRIKSDNSDIDLSNVKMSMNPFDEIAVEQAVQLKEQGLATEIVVVSIGVSQCTDILRAGLAMGADRAIHIMCEQSHIEPLSVAKILAQLCKTENPDLVICGKQAIDDDYNQTGQMLAGLLNWSQATFASEMTFHNDKIHVKREIDGGLETLAISKPAVITTDLRLNTPRYASLPNIMKAKQKPLSTMPITDFNVDITPRLSVVSVSEPAKRTAGQKFETVLDMVSSMKKNGVI